MNTTIITVNSNYQIELMNESGNHYPQYRNSTGSWSYYTTGNKQKSFKTEKGARNYMAKQSAGASLIIEEQAIEETTPEPIEEELAPADMADLEEIMSQPTLGPYTTEELTQLLTQETTPEHEGFTLCADGQTLVPSDKHFAGCECEACETKKWEQAEREQFARYNAIPAKLLTQDEIEDMAEFEIVAEQEYQEQLAVQANLTAFFKAAYDYCYTIVSDYTPQPHEYIYGSHYRPIWVVVPEPLDAKTLASYELELVRVPEAVLQAWNELLAVPSYCERKLADDRTMDELKYEIDLMRAEIAAKSACA